MSHCSFCCMLRLSRRSTTALLAVTYSSAGGSPQLFWRWPTAVLAVTQSCSVGDPRLFWRWPTAVLPVTHGSSGGGPQLFWRWSTAVLPVTHGCSGGDPQLFCRWLTAVLAVTHSCSAAFCLTACKTMRVFYIMDWFHKNHPALLPFCFLFLTMLIKYCRFYARFKLQAFVWYKFSRFLLQFICVVI
jgi:hypothetical protein